MDPVISSIRIELIDNSDEKTRESAGHFFREEVQIYGVKTQVVKSIAKKYWKDVKNRDKSEIFSLCEELFQSGYCEESFVVSEWIPRMKDRFSPEDMLIFRSWIERYINNWAACDTFCNHSIGDFIEKYPEYIEELKRWTRSENRWMRRASAVSLIVPAKRGRYLMDVLEISDLLLKDDDDLVRKGYGWLLKEASREHQDEVFEYVMRNKDLMPRTSLRYAIELMPKERRSIAMEKKKKQV
jgi:3-methyladenine DNA glycosylase AlkD